MTFTATHTRKIYQLYNDSRTLDGYKAEKLQLLIFPFNDSSLTDPFFQDPDNQLTAQQFQAQFSSLTKMKKSKDDRIRDKLRRNYNWHLHLLH
jgi:hypothetical protein